MSKLGQQRRFVPLLLADDYGASPPPGDGDGDGDPPVTITEDLIIPLWSEKRWGIAQAGGGTAANTNAMTFFADFVGQHFLVQATTVNFTAGQEAAIAGQSIAGSATSGSISGWGGTGYLGSPIMPLHNPKTVATMRTFADSVTGIRLWYGICENIAASTICGSDTPVAKYALFRFSDSVDTTLKAVVGDGTNVTVVDTGVAFVFRNYKFAIDVDQNGGRYLFYIDDVLVATITNDLPAVDTILYSFARMRNAVSAARTFVFNYVYQESDI